MYMLGGGRTEPPSLLTRLKAGFVLAVMLCIGAVVFAGILAVGLVLIPVVLVVGAIGYFVIRRRIRQAIRAMEEPRQDLTGRENVRVRRTTEQGPSFGDRPL